MCHKCEEGKMRLYRELLVLPETEFRAQLERLDCVLVQQAERMQTLAQVRAVFMDAEASRGKEHVN